MVKRITYFLSSVAVLSSTVVCSGSANAAMPADWSQIPTKTVKLFYPGQSSIEWLLSPAHKRANKKVAKGDSCASCHEGEEEEMGETIVSGEKLEPNPIPGKTGFKDLEIQAAYDADNLYLRFQWKSQLNREGRMHDMMRYDGKEWHFYGHDRASEKVRSGEEPPVYEDRLAIMIDDGKVPNFSAQGCWLTCHTGMRDMNEEAKKADVKAHPFLGKALKKSDIRKYLGLTRSDGSSWDKTKSADEITKLKAEGKFLDLMQWRVARSNPVGMADDGYVLEYRNFDAGKKMFSWNVDKKTMTPRYMFNPAKTGFMALREDDFANPAKATAVIQEGNAKPYDANAGFKEGDILPGRLLTYKTSGSAGDNGSVKGTWKDGVYTVIFSRRLNTGHPEDDKIMKVSGVYTVGFAVHDDNVTTRFHHVGFPLQLGIGVNADITAVAVR